MSTRNQRDGAKERFWRRVVRPWQHSGLSVRAFCAQQGLAEPSFYHWRRTLGERAAPDTTFVPVQVRTEEPEDNAGGAVELVLGDGRSLRLQPGFDAATVQRLLALLEGRPC